MRTTLFALLLALPVSPALADISFTGDRGTTVEKSRDCQRDNGQAICTIGTSYTGAAGKTAEKTRIRTTEAGQSATAITLTGPDGVSRTRHRLFRWGQ